MDKSESKGLYQIGKADASVPSKIAKSCERKIPDSTSKKILKRMRAAVEDDLSSRFELTFSSSEDAEDDRDSPEFHHVPTDREVQSQTQNQIRFPNLAQQSMRFGVSLQATSALAKAIPIDAGVVTEADALKNSYQNKDSIGN